MDHRLWSKLPAELLEPLLSFLPVVSVCRFRVVCRRWYDLFCSPEFGKLCLVNAARNASERACFVVNRKIEVKDLSGVEMSRWSVLDLREKKWYDLQPDLPWCCSLLDMDGGFVCTYAGSLSRTLQRTNFFHTNYNPASLIIFNSFGGAITVLPSLPSFDGDYLHRYSGNDMTLKLIVDNKSKTFKILLIMDGFVVDSRNAFCIYESSTDQCTTAPMPPFAQVPKGGRLSRVVFQGLLYCCFANCHNHDGMLWSFNFLDGSWEDAGVHFPNVGGSASYDLAVIDKRLFVTKIFQEEGSNLLLDISEILLAVKMTRAVMQTELSTVFPNVPEVFLLHRTRAFGFNRSKLLLCTPTGQVMMYNLVAEEWEWLPQCPLDDSYFIHEADSGRMDYFCLHDRPCHFICE